MPPEQNTPSEPPGGYFPLAVIRSILFGDDKLHDTPFKSKAPNDFAKVVKLPIGIGLYLKSLDPEEVYFHVESFAETQHSELWLAFEWIESSARQNRIRSVMSVERAIRDKHNQRMAEMTAIMPSGLSAADKNHLAETILREMSYQRYDQVLRCLNVAELYVKYEEEDKQATSQPPSGEETQPVLQGTQGVPEASQSIQGPEQVLEESAQTPGDSD